MSRSLPARVSRKPTLCHLAAQSAYRKVSSDVPKGVPVARFEIQVRSRVIRWKKDQRVQELEQSVEVPRGQRRIRIELPSTPRRAAGSCRQGYCCPVVAIRFG
jgi:hypothetical protein